MNKKRGKSLGIDRIIVSNCFSIRFVCLCIYNQILDIYACVLMYVLGEFTKGVTSNEMRDAIVLQFVCVFQRAAT